MCRTPGSSGAISLDRDDYSAGMKVMSVGFQCSQLISVLMIEEGSW